MSRCSARSLVAALVLGLALLTPWAVMAQPHGARTPSLDRSGLAAPADLANLVDLAGGAWSSLSRLWEKIGCFIDPNGTCPRQTPTATSKGGCGLDPDGRCVH